MNENRSLLFKDIAIIIFISVIILSVITVFYKEIIKKQKINVSKNNFYTVKEELSNEVIKCRDKTLNWIFENPCTPKPLKKDIVNYFNNTKNLINPHDKQSGVEGGPGSVLINLSDVANSGKILLLSVDTDANGGIDISHKIYIN